MVLEYAERIYAYMEKMQRNKKLRISRLTMVQNVIFVYPYFLYKMSWIYLRQKPFRATVPFLQVARVQCTYG
jgi:hypothetical protein